MSKQSPEYMLQHRKVHALRGKASDQLCIDCDEPAQEWAYRHDTDPDDVANYWSMCCSCHQKYDDHWNEDTKAKVSESVRKTWSDNPSRRVFSEEHRANMRAAWVRRKARNEGR